MRLVFKLRGANAGLNRHKGEGLYRSIGRKVFLSGLRKVTKDEADAIALKEKYPGKGIDVSTNTMYNADFVDSPRSDESVKESSTKGVDSSNIDKWVVESSTEGIDTSSTDESVAESSTEGIDSSSTDESTTKVVDSSTKGQENEDMEISIDDKEANINDNEEYGVHDADLKEDIDNATQKSGDKRKYTPSLVDFLINNNSDDASIPAPTKLQRFYSSDLREDNIHSINNLNDNESYKDERISEGSTNHQLTLIHPTKGKQYPQKKCVYCRRKYGLRNDTRYICTLCDVALCKEPCFF